MAPLSMAAAIYEPHLLVNQDEIGLSSPKGAFRYEDPESTVLIISRLTYDPQAMSFSLNKKPIDLTAGQFRLMHYLFQHAGNVCTREACAEAIWGREYDPGLDADALDRVVSNLRGKLRKIEPEATIIETRRGLGYVLNPSERRSLILYSPTICIAARKTFCSPIPTTN